MSAEEVVGAIDEAMARFSQDAALRQKIAEGFEMTLTKGVRDTDFTVTVTAEILPELSFHATNASWWYVSQALEAAYLRGVKAAAPTVSAAPVSL